MSPTYLFTIPESCKIIIENKRNSVIVRLPEKQYLKSVSVIIILTLLQRRLLNKEKSVVKLDYLKNYSSLFFRILLWFTVHPYGQMGIVSHDIFIINYLGCYHLNFISGSIFQSHFMFYLVLIYLKNLPTNVSSIPHSSNMTSFNKTNSMIVSLPGKQYLISIISLPLLESAMLKQQNSIVKLYYYFSKHSSFFFRIFLWFTVH